MAIVETPEISVVIASYNSRRTIVNCLRSLEKQVTSVRFEIIVVDSSTDGTGELVERTFPFVQVVRFKERKFCGNARNIGVSLAKGNIVAFIDADCVAEKNWIEEIVKAHAFPYPVIGGAIANTEPANAVSWAAFFCEFSQWMPGRTSRWMKDVCGANMSYKKTIFQQYGHFLEGTYCSDTHFHWRLGKGGISLRFVPSILVSHTSIDQLKELVTHEFFHGRYFPRVRIKAQHFLWMKRALYVIFSPLIPLKLFLDRSIFNITNRIYFIRFLKTSPLLALGLFCWSLGEVTGYIKGDRDELNS
jgi:GT2 family glycosyltransferase